MHCVVQPFRAVFKGGKGKGRGGEGKGRGRERKGEGGKGKGKGKVNPRPRAKILATALGRPQLHIQRMTQNSIFSWSFYLGLLTIAITAQHEKVGASEGSVVDQIDRQVVRGTESSQSKHCQVLRASVMTAVLSGHQLKHRRKIRFSYRPRSTANHAARQLIPMRDVVNADYAVRYRSHDPHQLRQHPLM